MAESDFWQALSDTIHRSVNLRIVTLVGDAGVTGTLERMEISAPTASADTLVTDINLVAGDITRIISERLLAADYADVRTAHEQFCHTGAEHRRAQRQDPGHDRQGTRSAAGCATTANPWARPLTWQLSPPVL